MSNGLSNSGSSNSSSNGSSSRHAAVQSQKRQVLTGLLGCCCQVASFSLLEQLAPNAAAAAAAAAAPAKDPTFYATWQYAGPADIIPFIKQQAAQGDSQAVLDAMDEFSLYYPQYKIGPEKGALFEEVLLQAKPQLALEIGTFLGYSAIRTARNLPPGGRLICVEANPGNAAVARELIAYAGFSADQVSVVEGLSGQVIPKLPQIIQQQQQQATAAQPGPSSFDVVFLDHCKDCYLPDLQALEQLGLLQPGSTVLADNVIYPGAPGFLEYLDSSGRYKTRLLQAKYEYEQAWNPDWEPNKDDAISVSVWS